MEPPVKRRRLGQPVQDLGDEEQNGDEDWEECEGDEGDEDNQEAAGEDERQGSVDRDGGYRLAIEKAYADSRFQATMARIYEKYGRDFEGIGDEIDMSTGEIVVHNGHLENMRHDLDVGIPGEAEEAESGEEGGGSDDGNLTDHDMADASPQVTGDQDGIENTEQNTIWVTEVDDNQVAPDYMQMQGSYPDPDALDVIPGYDHGATTEGGPSLMSGLYDGGGLRYSSSLGTFGASPFAVGPWQMLPPTQEPYHFSKQDGHSSVWASDYQLKDNESDQRLSLRAQLGLSGKKPRPKRPKALPCPDTHDAATQSANLFEQHPEEASALSVSDEKRYGKRQTKCARGKRRRNMTGKSLSGPVREDSDTIEDSLFSGDELDVSSQTGDLTDEAPQSKPSHAAGTCDRVIPDSQDTFASQDNDANVQPPAAKSTRLASHKPTRQDFDVACMLSDDESPLFLGPSVGVTNSGPKSIAAPTAEPKLVRPSGTHPGDTTTNKGRGRLKKGILPPTASRKQRRFVQKPLNPSGFTHDTANRNDRPLYNKHHPHSNQAKPVEPPHRNTQQQQKRAIPNSERSSNPPTIQPEAASGMKRKRGRPRKYPPPASAAEQEAQKQTETPVQPQPMPYPTQGPGQPFFYPPFPQAMHPQQHFPYPLQPFMPQPAFHHPFLQFPPPFPYQPIQYPFLQQPMAQMQHQMQHQMQQQMLQQPFQQFMQQPTLPVRNPLSPQRDQQPVKRKRGRPRKYPVGYKRSRSRAQPRPYQQIAGLQNSMTALLSGHATRTMVSEDAWYGVARSLAQDISSLHGSFLLANAFQAQTEPYAPNMMPPRSSSPEKSSESGSSSSDSEDEVVPYETSRITEVLEDENSVITSRRPATDAAETDTEGHSSAAETPGFEMQNGGPDDDSDDEDEDGVTMDDDAGFPTMESPVRVGQVVQPTPSPPSPPTSAHRSSSLVKYARPQRTPSPVRSIGRKTPLRLQTLKPRTPTSQQSDPFDLPSSPQPAGTFSQGSAGTFQNDGAEPEAPHDDSQKFLGSFQEVVDVESQVADEAKPCWIDDASRTDDMSAGLHRGSSALAGRQRESSEAAASPVSQARNKGSPNRAARAAASTGNVVATPTKPVTDVSPKAPPTSLTRLGPGQSKMTDFSTLADATPRKSPRAVRVSPKRTLLDTSATAVTPEKPAARRSAMVPRSTERCTPVFVESTAAPLKLPMLENRRTMKQLKQAVIAPRLKAVDPNPPASKGPPTNPGENPVRDMPGFPAEPKKALNSQAWKAASTKHTPEPKNTDSRAASSEPRLASRTKGSEPKASTRSISPTTSPPRHQPPDVVRRSAPRQPLPPRASVDSKSRAEQDQGDELGNLAKPKKASSSKPPRPFISSKIARDSSRKTRKPSPPTTEEHRPARERDGKGKKRRRADVPGTPAASGGSAAKVCGVDGYTCNRDFCFTCL